jgi:hypothetical protein
MAVIVNTVADYGIFHSSRLYRPNVTIRLTAQFNPRRFSIGISRPSSWLELLGQSSQNSDVDLAYGELAARLRWTSRESLFAPDTDFASGDACVNRPGLKVFRRNRT